MGVGAGEVTDGNGAPRDYESPQIRITGGSALTRYTLPYIKQYAQACIYMSCCLLKLAPMPLLGEGGRLVTSS